MMIRRRTLWAIASLLALFVAVLAIGGFIYRWRLAQGDLLAVRVSLNRESTSAEETETIVTHAIEQALSGIPNVASVLSTSSLHGSTITVLLDQQADIDQALKEIETRVEFLKLQLPGDIGKPEIAKVNPLHLPLLWIALESADMPLEELSRHARAIRRELAKVDGVGEIECHGCRNPTLQIQLDAKSLAAHGIDLVDAVDEIQQRHLEVSVDRLSGEDVAALKNIQLYRRDQSDVSLGDVAKIEQAWSDAGAARMHGRRIVVLGIIGFSDEGPATVAGRVNALLLELRKQLPGGASLSTFFDVSRRDREHQLLMDIFFVPGMRPDQEERVLDSAAMQVQKLLEAGGDEPQNPVTILRESSPAPTNRARLLVSLSASRHSSHELCQVLRTAIAEQPGVSVQVFDLSGQYFALARRYPVKLQLMGSDLTELLQQSSSLEQRMRQCENLVDVHSDALFTLMPRLELEPDAAALERLQIAPGRLKRFPGIALRGERVGTVLDGEERYPIVATVSPAPGTDVELLSLGIRTEKGELTPLKSVAAAKVIMGPDVITRVNSQRIIEITANIKTQLPAHQLRKELSEVVAEAGAKLPPDIRLIMVEPHP